MTTTTKTNPSAETQASTTTLKGGEFLIKETPYTQTFTPEDLNEEQRMFADMVKEFIEKEVKPFIPEMEKHNFESSVRLIEKAGELGILGASLPEQYGGLNVDFNTATIITEMLGLGRSFNVSIAAHTGIGTLPIYYYGTEAQKAEWLPKLASGEVKASYCLTEPGSGSDALAAKTKAELTEDGEHYIITGQKMWITNAGFADLFTVFAQVDGKFTGFIIPANLENIRLGAEEHKMGIHGSSTRQVFFEGVKIPKDNVLGEIGKGHKIAFNVLNTGRYKLCAMALGGTKGIHKASIKYANEREQFKTSIGNFGAIKHKIGEQAILIYACEAATYRTSELINQKIQSELENGIDSANAKLNAAEEYAIECAMLKVIGSEVLDYVVDEAVQIHGGMGYSEEMEVCTAYRDARINRIFEGTNEINRLLTVDMLLKRTMKGQLDLMTPAMAVQKELMAIPDFGNSADNELFHTEKKAIRQAKKAALMVAGAAVQKLGMNLEHEQEILMNVADMLNDIFSMESSLLRTEKNVKAQGEENASLHIAATKVFINDALERVHINGKRAVSSFAEGDEMRVMLMGIKRFTKYPVTNCKNLRRQIADACLAKGDYCF